MSNEFILYLGFGNKSITLYDIRAELNSRYKDLRTPFRSLNSEELFDVLTKETPEAFYVGKMILATVAGFSHRKPQGEQLDQANPVRNDETNLWQCPFCLSNEFPELSDVWTHFDAKACPGQATGVRLRLDNGISGFIHIKNLSDKHVKNPEERVQVGQMVHVRVTKIDVERFQADCSSKTSDLLDRNHEWRPQKDSYYDQDLEEMEMKKEDDSKKKQSRQQYTKRIIVHPSFYNISYSDALKIIDKVEVIVRPSSKGSDHLTVTWKIAEGIHQHIDVREKGKENAFSLGQSLWIGNEEFEDIDEIITRHVNPMAAFSRDLLAYKYYRDSAGGMRDKMEELLKEEKKKNANKIHYFLSASKSYPGKFLLSYLPRGKIRHEYVTVTPEGYRFRQQMFESVNSLLKWFKEHFKDPLPGGTPMNTPKGSSTVSSRNSYATPALSNSSLGADAIHKVAQNMPHHMMQSLSQATSHTPHYPHTPGYGQNINTPYTPSGQTPFMTPYHTPHHSPHMTPMNTTPYNTPHHTPHQSSHTPRYGQATPSKNSPFLQPGPPIGSRSHGAQQQSQTSPYYRASPRVNNSPHDMRFKHDNSRDGERDYGSYQNNNRYENRQDNRGDFRGRGRGARGGGRGGENRRDSRGGGGRRGDGRDSRDDDIFGTDSPRGSFQNKAQPVADEEEDWDSPPQQQTPSKSSYKPSHPQPSHPQPSRQQQSRPQPSRPQPVAATEEEEDWDADDSWQQTSQAKRVGNNSGTPPDTPLYDEN